MSGLTTAMIINGVVLAAVLESDVGSHRKVGRMRILRPLLTAAAIVPLYLKALTTHGTGLGLEIAGLAAGLLGGLAAVALTHVYRSPKNGNAVSRAGAGYAALWILIIGARAAFSYGSVHWFSGPLGRWMVSHDVSVAAITDTLILMAIAMVLTRTIGLALRAAALPAPDAASAVRPQVVSAAATR
jgi:Kef-type K+ transport system membrane component KefB